MIPAPIHFILNQEEIRTDQPPGTVLLDFIRGERRLHGTKTGCREGDCGACTVLVGSKSDSGVVYRSMVSCLMPLGNVHGKHVVTIEGLNGAGLTPIQQALVDANAGQCGFCTPGFVVSLTGFCLSAENPTYDAALETIAGNICRCTGYKAIERAVRTILEAVSECKAEGRFGPLIERGFLPDYFATIPVRLAALPEKEFIPVSMEKSTGQLVGGGTDLYVQQPQAMVEKPITFLSVREALKGIRLENGCCVIGGATTLEDLRSTEILNNLFPRLKQDLKRIASKQIRHMATVAGNLVNASPIADMAVFLLALDAEVVLDAQGSKRTLALKDFYKGYKKLDLEPGEVLEAVRFRVPEGQALFNFEKIGKRTHLDIAGVNSAMALQLANSRIIRADIAVGGVAPIPLHLKATSAYLIGRPIQRDTVRGAAETALREIAPISDVRGSAEYRRLLVRQLIYAHFLTLFPGHPGLKNLI
ncbi:MAG: (2Fe-2S)-binding protein [Desulfobacteraceae bacterium]|nr:MAG: (2Fe-2S)-binding protein [Desulfobacteraceae bacterium]